MQLEREREKYYQKGTGLRGKKQEMNLWPCWCLGHVIIYVPNFLICALSHWPPGELLGFPALNPQSWRTTQALRSS